MGMDYYREREKGSAKSEEDPTGWEDCHITLEGPLWDSRRRSTLPAVRRNRKLCQRGKHTRDEREMNGAEKNAVLPRGKVGIFC